MSKANSYPARVLTNVYGEDAAGNFGKGAAYKLVRDVSMAGSNQDPSQSVFYWKGNVAGTITNTQPVFANVMQADSFSVNAAAFTGVFRAYANLGGASHKGGFTNIDSTFLMNVKTGNVRANAAFYQAANFSANASANDSGTSGLSSGSLDGICVYAVLRAGATYWLNLQGQETDIAIQSGASAEYVVGNCVILEADNAVAASVENLGFLVGAQGGAVPTLDCAYAVGGYQGYNPLASTGGIMKYILHANVSGAPSIAYGVDLTNCTFSGNAFASAGFSVNGAGSISGSGVKTQRGTSQFLYNSYAAQLWDLSYGTAAAPVTTIGPVFKISKTEFLDDALAVNKADNESNAALAVYSVGNPGSEIQTNAGLFAAKGSPTGTDVVGLWTTGLVNGSGNGIGTGAYIEGRRDTTTGKMMGAEVRVTNQTAVPVAYNQTGFNSSALWLTAGGTANSPVGVALGPVNGQKFDVGFAATTSSVASQTFRDDSSSVTSVDINGAHTDGIDLTGGTFSGAQLKATGLTISPTGSIQITPRASVAIATNGVLEFEATSNTTLTIKYRGSDGTTRSVALALS